MVTTASNGYQLVFGGLELMEYDAGSFTLNVLGVNAAFGSPAPVSEVMSSLMVDGDLTATSRFGNRVATFDVVVGGADPGALAVGEAALMGEIDRVSTLTWHVPYGPPTVFDVVRSWPEQQFDDLAEVLWRERTFRISLELMPFGRSVDPVVQTWTGPVRLSDLSSTGWTKISGATPSYGGGSVTFGAGASVLEFQPTLPLDDYVWLKWTGDQRNPGAATVTDVSVGGVSIPPATIGQMYDPAGGGFTIYRVPTATWRGLKPAIRFTSGFSVQLKGFYTIPYPSASTYSDTKPRGIGALDVIGSARTPVKLEFTAPTGGAFVYTAPDPNAAIRRGVQEIVFGVFTVSSADGAEVNVGMSPVWFPKGDHATMVGITAPQPVELFPNGVFPNQVSGATLYSGLSAFQFSYPADNKAATTYFASTGAKSLISATPSLPEGYRADAIHHEEHVLHPGRCGFAVLDKNGDPITTTITYYPHWWNHAAQ